MYSKYIIVILSAIIAVTSGLECNNPEVHEHSFTTQDATIVSQIAYITEFTLKCSNDGGDQIALFAEVEGRLTPVARVGPNKFQVSWNEEIKKSRSGDYDVRLFDEEGFAAVRKVQRSGGDVNDVKALVKLVVRHPGAFKGPWVDSELLAVGLAFVIAYVAFSTKNKILS